MDRTQCEYVRLETYVGRTERNVPSKITKNWAGI